MADKHLARAMRSFWDDGARRNALWYVDTSLDYDNPDLDTFFDKGRVIVDDAFRDAPVSPPGRELAVEIGCGLGRVCAALAGRFDRVIGVDISPEMLKRARELVREPNVDLRLGNGVNLDGIQTASADFVITFTVFQHIPNVDVINGYIAEAGRVLKPGGVFVFQWNNEPGPLRWRLRRTALSALQRSGVRPDKYRRYAPEFLGSRVPVAQLQRGLTNGGLALEGLRREGTLWPWAWAKRRP